ncbi:hypothetical protein [Mucilaginibacter sp.]|jgi:predicted SprT family Zn-dependent metalloprotease|uniref:hypothetical protein n=1 Tax=Mucilaginibacter sp. TaxID=1882438 RepID=UPI003567E1C1
MRFFLILVLLYLPFSICAQNRATIDITLQNTKRIKVERRSIFEKPVNYNLTKIDEEHYSLNYFDNKPGVIYINGRPILVTPGDDVKLMYKLIVWDDESFKDTITATGNNAKNYTFSNFVTVRKIDGEVYLDFKNVKYQNNSLAFYADLAKFHAFRLKYYNFYLHKYSYDKSFIDYIARATNFEFLSNAIYFESELATYNKKQFPAFSEKVSTAFLNTNFIPADTSYTYRMEETFSAFFYNLTHIKFNPIDSEKNFDNLLNYIVKYPNPFVREYFFYFLITKYNKVWAKYRPKDIIPVIQNIKNPAIKNALKNYTY